MAELTYEIGQKIKSFRQKKNMTVQELADAICKSKATVSKYESGHITIDIVTLYDISKTLGIHVEQLLHCESTRDQLDTSDIKPSFFKGLSRFYAYMFDGRSNSLNRCVVDILSKNDNNQYKVMMYMNIDCYEKYQKCENTYWGYIKHFDALTNIILYNQDTPMEQITICILASYLDSPTKWGLFFGVSSRPLMPVATKILLSKKILPETPELIKTLHISKEDIRILKMYNMMTVT
jgi:transcriptional regulator with XRE-family HTH domain